MRPIELGLDTFGDVTLDADGRPLPHAQVLRNVVAEAVLADQLGVDFIGVGEHHRADFAISAPEVVLAAIAARTERIRLGTAVTVLSSDDPVRVYQRFATLDAVSNGRAEVILGRGSFTESFPLFGYSLEDYDDLFEEKLALFAAIRDADRTGSRSTGRAPCARRSRASASTRRSSARRSAPGSASAAARSRWSARRATASRSCSPSSAATRGASRPTSSSTTARSPSSASRRRCRSASTRRATSPTPTSRRARSSGRTTRSCGTGSAPSAAGRRPAGPSSTTRSPRARCTSARPRRSPGRSPRPCGALGASRFDLKYSAGTLPHEAMMRSIELYGREVIPRVRELVGEASPVGAEQGIAASRS